MRGLGMQVVGRAQVPLTMLHRIRRQIASLNFGQPLNALGDYFCSGAGNGTPDIEFIGVVRDARHTNLGETLDSKLVLDSFRTMEEQVDDSLSNERAISLLATSFGLSAAILASSGIYGVLSYATTQRTA